MSNVSSLWTTEGERKVVLCAYPKGVSASVAGFVLFCVAIFLMLPAFGVLITAYY